MISRVPTFKWPEDPYPVLARLGGGEATTHAHWAVRVLDELYYLADLDERDARARWAQSGHSSDTVDLAHARWAASTAMTALDLCAAALGFRHQLPRRGSWVHDVEQLNVPSNRGKLCVNCDSWVDRVRADPGYGVLKGVRDPLVHRTLPRFLYLTVNAPGSETERLGLSWSGVPG